MVDDDRVRAEVTTSLDKFQSLSGFTNQVEMQMNFD